MISIYNNIFLFNLQFPKVSSIDYSKKKQADQNFCTLITRISEKKNCYYTVHYNNKR